MQIDATTIKDLAIFNNEESGSVFQHFNQAITTRGKEQMQYLLLHPLSSAEAIMHQQDCLKFIIANQQLWPKNISNGTVMVVDRFFTSNISPIPSHPNVFEAKMYRIINSSDYSLVKYSGQHLFDFIKGMSLFVERFLKEETPLNLRSVVEIISGLIDKPIFQKIIEHKSHHSISIKQLLEFTHFIRYKYKRQMMQLLQNFSMLDAWYGMAMATQKFNLVFPEVQESEFPFIEAKGLYHPLIEEYVSYDIELNQNKNFLFLTGANMAGKSTFIKAMGISTFIAHTGMGVPAKSMKLSYISGLLSNINVVDNVVKGESFFFNEVQRIKSTIQKINNNQPWLVLIDELFKGTNVEDAMKCSTAVIEGLLKIKTSLFIVSTHLYEIGHQLKKFENIQFKYFETNIEDEHLNFSYQLKDGISNDRLGYLILKKEGVVDLLNQLG